MTVVLHHTIVPVGDKRRGAQVLADLPGLEVGAPAGPFVDDAKFDRALDVAKKSGLPWAQGRSRSRK